jgi:hypothetical protein
VSARRAEQSILKRLEGSAGEEQPQRVSRVHVAGVEPSARGRERLTLSETVAPLLRDLAATCMRLPDIRPEAHHLSRIEGY